MRFALSTLMFIKQKLDREILRAIRAAGFEAIEIFCYDGHYDYKSPEEVQALAAALEETGLHINSLHAPLSAGPLDQSPRRSFSIADPDETRRTQAVAEMVAALSICEYRPVKYLVTHLGGPRDPADENRVSACRLSLLELAARARPYGVTVAVENIPNPLSTIAGVVQFLDAFEDPSLRVCLDTGHALIAKELPDGISLLQGRVETTHIHDNMGEQDDHMLPYEGRIPWDAVLATLKDIQYSGAYLLELEGHDRPMEILAKAAGVIRRMADQAP